MSGPPPGSTLLDLPVSGPADGHVDDPVDGAVDGPADRPPVRPYGPVEGPPDDLAVTHRELAELQRTVATKATQLEQLAIDLDRLVGAADGSSPPWVALIDERFRRAWAAGHRPGLRRLITDLEDQARQLGDLRRHLLLPAAGEVARDPGRDER
jgi:hypothetical protein